MGINQYFIENYLTSGVARDNMVFTNCSDKLLFLAISRLKEDNNNCLSAVISFTDYECSRFEDVLSSLSNKYQKDIVARDYIISRIMEALLAKVDSRRLCDFSIGQIRSNQEDLFSGDKNRLSNFVSNSPMPFDLEKLIKGIGRVELDFILENFKSRDLQKAINNYLSSRTSYCVRVFTGLDNLITYYDQMGNLIQSPHDYLNIDVRKFEQIDENINTMQN